MKPTDAALGGDGTLDNVVPNLQDAGGVLASRFIKVAFQRSFAGKEDVNLRAKLAAELPGIAVRCLAAYRRLLRRGHFIQLRSAADLEAQINEQANGFPPIHERVL